MKFFDDDLSEAPLSLLHVCYSKIKNIRFFAGLICLTFLLLFVSNAAQAAAFATGGDSKYKDDVLWLTWGGGELGTVNALLNDSSRTSANITLPNGTSVTITCGLSNITPASSGDAQLSSYAPGAWTGDGLDDLYNVGGTGAGNKLVNGISRRSGKSSFTVSCSSTQNYQIKGLVMADAESMNPNRGSEFVEATAAGEWNVVELSQHASGNYQGLKTNGGRTIKFGPGNDAGTAAVTFLTFDTPSSSISMDFALKGADQGGKTAIAIGLLVPNADFGDAPQSYGEVTHLIESLNVVKDNMTDGVEVDLTAPGFKLGGLEPLEKNFIGTRGPDAEKGQLYSDDALGDDLYPSGLSQEEDGWPHEPKIAIFNAGKPLTREIKCSGNGTVAGWIDFDQNGAFDNAERAEALCSGGTAALTWNIPAELKDGETFVRLRFATNASEIISPIGLASDGEAEDHLIEIVAPKLKIEKSANSDNGKWPLKAGTMAYTLTVSNTGTTATGETGSATGTEITVLDLMPDGILPDWDTKHNNNGWTCSYAGQLVTCKTSQVINASASSQIELPVKITEGTEGTLINYASVGGGGDPYNEGKPSEPNSACTDADHCANATVEVELTPGLTLIKTGELQDLNGNNAVDEAETINYTFVVTNTGNVTLKDVKIQDSMLAAGVVTPESYASVAPGEKVTFTARHIANLSNINAGQVLNVATATGTPPGGTETESNTSEFKVPADQKPALTIVKTGVIDDIAGGKADHYDLGEKITYTFTVKNTGSVTLATVTVKDDFLQKAGVAVEPASHPSLAPNEVATFTATYTVTQADIDAGKIVNTAMAEGTPPNSNTAIPSQPDTDTKLANQDPALELKKTGQWNDEDGSKFPNVGETITYEFTVTNTGPVKLKDVSPVDTGPEFNGVKGTGSLSQFSPAPVELAPQETQKFTATYTLTQADIDAGAGRPDAVTNNAYATSIAPGNKTFDSNEDLSLITLPAAEEAAVIITKRALVSQIRRGEKVPYVIRVENTSSGNVGKINVTDLMPSGFRYVEGSAKIDNVAVEPQISGRRLVFKDLQLGPKSKIQITLQLLALSTAGPGKHKNIASVADPSGKPLANDAAAYVEIIAEHVFDCGEIIGTVFDDRNSNGYQDQGEPGLPGVRVATVKGWLITTDKYGRFHVPCAALPDQRIGSNFIMKLDTRTLPTGYRLTTENPRVVRLTAGKMTKLNFGASIGRVVRLDLENEAFEHNSTELKQEWSDGIDELITVLGQQRSVLRLSYIADKTDSDLAQKRIDELQKHIAEQWRKSGSGYPLDIETRVELGQ